MCIPLSLDGLEATVEASKGVGRNAPDWNSASRDGLPGSQRWMTVYFSQVLVVLQMGSRMAI